MARHLKKISISFTLSCLLLNLGYGSTPCQNGHDYNNKCDPYYNINLIQAKVSNDRNRVARRVLPSTANSSTTSHNIAVKTISAQRQSDLSYLDTLRSRYSSQFNGRMGLQALIDRSKYINLKKVDKTETTKTTKTKLNNKETKKHLSKPDEKQVKTKHISKNTTEKKTTDKKTIDKKTKIAKHTTSKLVLKKNKISKNKHTVKKTQPKVSKKSTSLKKSKFYTVKEGDNLIKIAKKFAVSKSSIESLNRLDKNATIKVGQKLALPKSAKNIVRIAKLDVKKAKKAKKIKKSNLKGAYIVQSGDTLSSIAKKKKISLVKLREINRLSRSGKIRVGQKLMLVASKAKKRKVKNYDIVKNIKFRKTPSLKYKRKIRVVATAYTSHVGQTDKTPFLAAWNNRIRPGMKIIAVSPDLIRKYGLTNGVKVKILGLPGYYVIRDKMNARLRNHIDIYMGVNKHRALQWGRKRIVLYW